MKTSAPCQSNSPKAILRRLKTLPLRLRFRAPAILRRCCGDRVSDDACIKDFDAPQVVGTMDADLFDVAFEQGAKEYAIGLDAARKVETAFYPPLC
jgi:hypothetical protein